MSLLKTRAVIAAQLDAALKRYLPATLAAKLNTATHNGIFDEAELFRQAVTSPAVRVALLGTENMTIRGNVTSCEAIFGVFVVTMDEPGGLSRDTAALSMLPIILATITDNRWCLDSSEGKPTAVKSDNLFSSHFDNRDAALWSVNFRQRIVLSGGLDIDPSAITKAELAAAVESADGNSKPCPQAAQPIAPGGHCPTCKGTEHTGHMPLPGTGINEFLRSGYGDALEKNPDKGLFPVRKQGN